MSQRAHHEQQAVYLPSANRASCPAEVTILRAGGQQALQPPALPEVPKWRSGAAVRGEKRRWQSRAGPPLGRAGRGRTERLPTGTTPQRCQAGGNRKELTVTSRHSATRARRTTLQPQWGCPPKATGGGDWGRGLCTHRAGRGRLGGATRDSLSRAARACHPGQGKDREHLTSDTTLRLPV